MEQTLAPAIQVPLANEVSRLPGRIREFVGMPKVIIQGDIRLRFTESYAARRPVKAHYQIEMEEMPEPL